MEEAASDNSLCQTEAKSEHGDADTERKGSRHWLGVGPDDLLSKIYVLVLCPS